MCLFEHEGATPGKKKRSCMSYITCRDQELLNNREDRETTVGPHLDTFLVAEVSTETVNSHIYLGKKRCQKLMS
jgi:hypothetical protein